MTQTVKPTRRALQTHFDAVVYFFSILDAEMISDLLDDKLMYLDYHKHQFIQKIDDLFFFLNQSGETKLIPLVDDEPLPVKGSFGITFEGSKSAYYLEIIFEVDEHGYITDIYEIEESQEEFRFSSERERLFINQFSMDEEQKYLTFDDDEDIWN